MRMKILFASMLSFSALTAAAHAQSSTMTVYKDAYCGCCEGWVEHMKNAGFNVVVQNMDDMAAVKAKHGVSASLAGCHTAVVDGYVVEGHVPAVAVKKLLTDRPEADGIAAPGMPMGSPGMDGPSVSAKAYDVLLFDGEKADRFGTYKGSQEL